MTLAELLLGLAIVEQLTVITCAICVSVTDSSDEARKKSAVGMRSHQVVVFVLLLATVVAYLLGK